MRKTVIAVSGSRSISDSARIYEILDEEIGYQMGLGAEIVLHLGDAKGVDAIALTWARERAIKRTIFFADRDGFEFWTRAKGLREWPSADEQAELASDWGSDGKKAGAARNAEMIRGADLLVAIWDGQSAGCRHAMACARNAGVFIHQWGGDAAIAFRSAHGNDAKSLVEWHE